MIGFAVHKSAVGCNSRGRALTCVLGVSHAPGTCCVQHLVMNAGMVLSPLVMCYGSVVFPLAMYYSILLSPPGNVLQQDVIFPWQYALVEQSPMVIYHYKMIHSLVMYTIGDRMLSPLGMCTRAHYTNRQLTLLLQLLLYTRQSCNFQFRVAVVFG